MTRMMPIPSVRSLTAASALFLALFPVATNAASAPAVRVVTITAREYAFSAPTRIPAGRTTLRMVNRGKELHHVAVVGLDAGHSLADLFTAMKRGGPMPAWAHELGGPNATAPGGEASTTLDLSAGQYAFLCFVPSADGVPHVMKGMAQAFTVVAARGTTARRDAAAPVRTMTLDDYGFRLSSPLTAGTTTLRVTNAARQPHEVFVVRLAAGKTAQDMAAWIDKQAGPPPGMPMGGVSGLESGAWNDLTVTLTPGDYALLCFLPDAKDGKPHVAHGMLAQVSIR